MFCPGNQFYKETSNTHFIVVERHFSSCVNKDFNVELFGTEELRGNFLQRLSVSLNVCYSKFTNNIEH